MRFTQKREDDVIATIDASPDACVTFDQDAYRDDGHIIIHRKGMGQFLHRYLYRQLIDARLVRGIFLLQSCRTPGCVNPYHRIRSTTPTHPLQAPMTCPNGHEYTPKNTEIIKGHRRCRTCHERQLAKLRSGGESSAEINRAKTHCPQNHPYNDENTYVATDKQGRKHRKCRTCERDRQRLARQSPSSPSEGTA